MRTVDTVIIGTFISMVLALIICEVVTRVSSWLRKRGSKRRAQTREDEE
jgi:ABC-type proline/glycine betaine transport system permease subunit